MTPTNEDYAIAAFCEAATNGVSHEIMWAAVTCALREETRRVNSVLLDANVNAAIQAGEWLDRVVETNTS